MVLEWNQAMLVAQSLVKEPIGVGLGVTVAGQNGTVGKTKTCSLAKQRR